MNEAASVMEVMPRDFLLETPLAEPIPVEAVEIWDDADLWDDDTLVAAHEGAAEDLREYVRSQAEQQARDGIAAKALGIIVSAAESKFTNEGRRLNLLNQLIASLGSLCDHNHLSEALDKHLPGQSQHNHNQAEAEADDDDDDDDPKTRAHSNGQKKQNIQEKSQESLWAKMKRMAGIAFSKTVKLTY